MSVYDTIKEKHRKAYQPMILAWLIYLSGITGFSLFQIYIAIKLFKWTKSIIGLTGLLLLGLVCLFYFSNGSLLFHDPSAWFRTSPLQHIWSQISALWTDILPWLVEQVKEGWKYITH